MQSLFLENFINFTNIKKLPILGLFLNNKHIYIIYIRIPYLRTTLLIPKAHTK